MSFFENINIAAQDSPTIDAFARLRTSDPYTLFDSKQLDDEQPLFWSTSLTGTATSAYSQTDARTRLSVVNNGDIAIRSTKQYFNYQPGKSQLIFITGVFAQETDVIKSAGLYNTDNGILFNVSASDMSWSISKNGTVTEEFSQADWNIDKFDGSGKSGVTLDLNQAQILYIDYEWLGVGRVRCGFVIDGIPYVAHEFNHANRSGFNSVYMTSPNLPIRYYIRSIGGSGTIDHICASVISEGGQETTGISRSVDNGINKASISGGVSRAVLAIRKKLDKNYSTITLKNADILSTGNDLYKWAIVLNPVAGTKFNEPGTGWTSLSNSTLEYKTNIAADITSYDIQIASGYGTTTIATTAKIESFLKLGIALSGKRDIIALVITPVSNGTFLASLNFTEKI